MPLNILVQSNSPHIHTGYGVSTGILTQVWQKLGHKVNYFAFYGIEGAPMEWNGMLLLPKGMSNFGEDVVWSHATRCGADILITNVDVFVLRNYGSGPIPWLPITPVMEDPLQPGISGALHGAIDIAAISKYSQRVLKEGGYPSTYIPLPIQPEIYIPVDKERAKASLGFPSDAYIIGNVGMNRGNRKGHDTLLHAFQIFLAEVPNAYLWIHTDTHQADGIQLEPLVNHLGLQNNVRFPVRYDAFYGKPQSWMTALYNAFDLYVQPSRNEGQGMPMIEAMSCGLPVVATEATSLIELIDGAEALPVQYSDKRWLPGEGYSYEITAEDLAEKMLEAHAKWGHGYVSMKNRQRVIRDFSVPVIGHKWSDELFRMEKRIRFSPKVRPWVNNPKIVQVSTDVRNCGIGNYTRALMASMEPYTEQTLVEVRSVENIKQIPECDVVHWHFEPSISPKRNVLEEVFEEIRNRGSRLVVTMHAIDVKMCDYLLQKEKVTEIVLHWPLAGMNVAHPKMTVLGGMGCPSYNLPRNDDRVMVRAKFGFTPQDVIISTFGFAAVGRGHFEIPLELAPTLKVNPHLHLQLILPGNFLNETGRSFAHDQIHRIIEAYGLQNQIHLIGDYLPDTEVLDRLWLSDVGYLYMGMDTASSSSAIRFFISSRLPTVVTHSSHFSDVRMGVERVESFSVIEFTAAIRNLIYQYEKRSRMMHELNQVYAQWNWPKFGEKMLQVYKKVQE